MPHHLVIADTVQVEHILANATRSFSIVTHSLIPAGLAVSPALAESYFAAVKALWATNVAPHCPATTGFVRVRMRDLRSEGLPLVESTGSPVPGTDTITEALPYQIAACLTVRTNRAGRKFRGRMYWNGFSEGANGSGGSMTAPTKTGLDAFAAGFIGAANVQGLQLGVAHRPTAFDEITGLPISPGLGFTTVATSVLCRDSIWDNQRRRG